MKNKAVHIAYTVGHTSSYDQGLQEEPELKKTGRSEEYEGGWIWKTSEEARAFLSTELFRKVMPNRNPTEFSVYSLALPNGWDTDAMPGYDGVHLLLHNAKIIAKV